jgi:prepilin-type N-terminal cleavage/methylation domain-containing protein
MFKIFNNIVNTRIESGFTLMEVLVSLVIIGMIAMIATTVTPQGARDEECYDATIKIMDNLKQAIIGVPPTHLAGERRYMGYIADIGELPELVGKSEQPAGLWTEKLSSIDELATDLPLWAYTGNESRLWIGWHGPYVEPPSGGVLRDGWGNTIIFERFNIDDKSKEIIDQQGTNLRIKSLGSDGKAQKDDDKKTGYEKDIEYLVLAQDYLGDLAGYADTEVDSMVINYPLKGNLVSKDVQFMVDRYFVLRSENGVPMGTRSLRTAGNKNKTTIFSMEPAGNWLGTVK